jgi:hypothetical protein
MLLSQKLVNCIIHVTGFEFIQRFFIERRKVGQEFVLEGETGGEYKRRS